MNKFFKWLPHHVLDKALAYAQDAADTDHVVDIVLKRGRYHGSVEYHPASDSLHGQILGIKGLVMYDAESTDLMTLIKYFDNAVKSYDDGVKARVFPMPKPYKGQYEIVDLDKNPDLKTAIKRLRPSCRDTYLGFAAPGLVISRVRDLIVLVEWLTAIMAITSIAQIIVKVTL